MLFRQKVRRRQSAGIEMSLIDLNAETGKFLRQFARRPLTGVGQEEKLLLVFVQPVYEVGRPRQKFIAVVDHSVHIGNECAFVF